MLAACVMPTVSILGTGILRNRWGYHALCTNSGCHCYMFPAYGSAMSSNLQTNGAEVALRVVPGWRKAFVIRCCSI